MEEFASAINNLTMLLIVIGGSIFTLCVAVGAILYMTAAGDPHKQQIARGALVSSLLGVVILAMSPVAPQVLSRFVIEPSGGQALDRVGQAGCDRTLRSALVTQRSVSTQERANSMIRQIQAQRRAECSTDTWNPYIYIYISEGLGPLSGDANLGDENNGCLDRNSPPDTETHGKIGDTTIPRTLGNAAASDGDGIARDADGNILVLFRTTRRPSDGSLCWLYLASADIWDQAADTPKES